MPTGMCHIPVTGYYRKIDGQQTMVSGEYVDADAGLIARFLIHGFGEDAIFGSSMKMEEEGE